MSDIAAIQADAARRFREMRRRLLPESLKAPEDFEETRDGGQSE